MHKINEGEFEQVARLVNELCGVSLGADKKYLVETRLGPVLDRYELPDFGSLVRALRAGPQGALMDDAVDAITTHETSFFRDAASIDAFQFKALPEMIDRRRDSKKLRIWCAACSTGQEPYSIAMLVRGLLGFSAQSWDVQIVGSDISSAAVERAQAGLYKESEISRCSRPADLQKNLTRSGDHWLVSEPVREMVTFEVRNLMEPFTGMGPFDFVFCRNVSIYFARDVRIDLFRRIRSILARPDGILFVGSSECLSDLDPSFEALMHCRSRFYMPNA